jgi:hypothetical protein
MVRPKGCFKFIPAELDCWRCGPKGLGERAEKNSGSPTLASRCVGPGDGARDKSNYTQA